MKFVGMLLMVGGFIGWITVMAIISDQNYRRRKAPVSSSMFSVKPIPFRHFNRGEWIKSILVFVLANVLLSGGIGLLK